MHEENVLLDIIYPVGICEMSTFWVGTVLGIWNTSVNEVKISVPQEKCILVGGNCQ